MAKKDTTASNQENQFNSTGLGNALGYDFEPKPMRIGAAREFIIDIMNGLSDMPAHKSWALAHALLLGAVEMGMLLFIGFSIEKHETEAGSTYVMIDHLTSDLLAPNHHLN